jgi:hypothetical protein
MADFQTFDLGKVIHTAESINALKRQRKTDALQDRYLEQRIQAGEQDMQRQSRAEQVVLGKEKAQQVVAKTGYILQAQNPKNYIEQNEPDLVKHLTAGGVDWATADDNAIRQMVQAMQQRASAELGQGPSAPESFTLRPGETRFAGGQPIASAPQSNDITPYQRERLAIEREKARTGTAGTSSKLITRPVGEGLVQDFAWNPKTNTREPAGEPYRPVTPQTGNVTEGERKAAALGTRLDAAMTELNAIEQRAPGASRPGVMERGLEAIGSEMGANFVRSSERQQADAAQLDALDAALTLATGAAYTREQLQNLRKSYFPQINDTDAQVAAKRKRFETIVQTARIAAGRAEPSIDKANRGSSGSWEQGQSQQIGGFTVRRVK